MDNPTYKPPEVKTAEQQQQEAEERNAMAALYNQYGMPIRTAFAKIDGQWCAEVAGTARHEFANNKVAALEKLLIAEKQRMDDHILLVIQGVLQRAALFEDLKTTDQVSTLLLKSLRDRGVTVFARL